MLKPFAIVEFQSFCRLNKNSQINSSLAMKASAKSIVYEMISHLLLVLRMLIALRAANRSNLDTAGLRAVYQ
jgi:hypothetical protein